MASLGRNRSGGQLLASPRFGGRRLESGRRGRPVKRVLSWLARGLPLRSAGAGRTSTGAPVVSQPCRDLIDNFEEAGVVSMGGCPAPAFVSETSERADGLAHVAAEVLVVR